MKYVAVICLAIFALANAEDDTQIMEECKKSSGWDGNWKDEKNAPAMKAFHECTLKKFQVMKEDGTLDKQRALDMVDKIDKLNPEQKEKLKETTSLCMDQVKPSSDTRETANQLYDCFHEHMKGMKHD